MVKIGSGVAAAATRFVIVGLAFPWALDAFRPEVSVYVTLPPPQQVWNVMLIFGAAFAAVGFLQKGYSKGDFPWLLGVLGGGLVAVAFYSYIFLLLPNNGPLGESSLQATGLLTLIYASIGLSYLHLILDFVDARRSRRKS